MALAPHAATVAAVPPLDGMRAVPSHDHRRCAPLPYFCACCCCRLCCSIRPRSRTTTGAPTQAPPRQVFLYSFARKLDRIFSMLSDSLASPVRACALVARAQCAWRRPLTCTSALSIGETSIEHAILKYTRAVRTRTREHTLIHSFDARRGMNAYAQLRLTLTVCSQRRTSCYDEPARRGDRYHRHGATYASPRTMRANASGAPFA